MCVDYSACAGIGIKFNEETVMKFDSDLWERFIESDSGFDFLEELLVESECIDFEQGGNAWSGNTFFCLFASDPIFGIVDFISEMHMIGFTNLEKTDLLWINEVYIS
jgi:hypothetical protein